MLELVLLLVMVLVLMSEAGRGCHRSYRIRGLPIWSPFELPDLVLGAAVISPGSFIESVIEPITDVRSCIFPWARGEDGDINIVKRYLVDIDLPAQTH